MLTDDDSQFDDVQGVRQLPGDEKVAIAYAAAQLACVIEVNFPELDSERIENLAIEFAYRLFVAQRQN